MEIKRRTSDAKQQREWREKKKMDDDWVTMQKIKNHERYLCNKENPQWVAKNSQLIVLRRLWRKDKFLFDAEYREKERKQRRESAMRISILKKIAADPSLAVMEALKQLSLGKEKTK